MLFDLFFDRHGKIRGWCMVPATIVLLAAFICCLVGMVATLGAS